MASVDSKQIDELEARLRRGDYASVRDFLRNTSRSEIPDRLVLRLSQLARRIDYAKKGLLLLRDRVIDLPTGERPNPREQAEYAACLLKLGAVAEARRILLEVPVAEAPEALKFLAFTYVHQWDYASVIPHLREYVARLDITPYDRIIGSVNLSAALVGTESYGEALAVLEPLFRQLKSEGHQLMLGNVCELMAQVSIHTGQFDQASVFIEKSWDSLKEAQPRYRLYLEKWRAIGALLKDPRDGHALGSLRGVRSKAIEGSEWEVIRECDFYESLILGDEKMFLHLYFGTPHPSYRAKMMKKSEGRITIPSTYVWGNTHDRRVLDLDSGRDKKGGVVLKKNQALHRLSKALAFDFYAPAPVAQLFAHVFEEARFHPETSPHRVHELVRRLKSHLDDQGYELALESIGRGYKLDSSRCNFSFVLTAGRPLRPGLLGAIEQHFGVSEFKLRELSERLGVPHTTVYRELKRLASSRSLVVIGTGKETRYRLVDSVGSPKLDKAS